ncbi:MAG: hypothetical protein ACTSYS_00675 [Promethearchaeota archaeon]
MKWDDPGILGITSNPSREHHRMKIASCFIQWHEYHAGSLTIEIIHAFDSIQAIFDWLPRFEL